MGVCGYPDAVWVAAPLEACRQEGAQAVSDYFAEHAGDMIPVRLIDLVSAVTRMRQVQAEGLEAAGVVHERIFTCDLPRLEGYLPAEAMREIKSRP